MRWLYWKPVPQRSRPPAPGRWRLRAVVVVGAVVVVVWLVAGLLVTRCGRMRSSSPTSTATSLCRPPSSWSSWPGRCGRWQWKLPATLTHCWPAKHGSSPIAHSSMSICSNNRCALPWQPAVIICIILKRFHNMVKIGQLNTIAYKKFELMLTRRSKAYSSSGSVVLLKSGCSR